MNISTMYRLKEALKIKAREIKTQRQRIKACRRMMVNEAHTFSGLCANALQSKSYGQAKILDKHKDLCFERVKGLDKIDYYFESQQKAIGRIIVEINAYPKYGVHPAREAADLLKLQEKTLSLLIQQSDTNFATRHWSF